MAKRRSAPSGCYWRGDTLWARVKIKGQEHRWSLHTGDPAVARARYKAGKERLSGDAHHGDSPRSFVETFGGLGEVDSRSCERRENSSALRLLAR
jgi:integrase/recombinase XerD